VRQVSGQERPVSILCTASAEQEILICFSTENKGGGVASHLSIAHCRGTFSVKLAGKRPIIPATPQLVRFGVFELDLNTGELCKNGRKLKLQEQPFRILSLLLEQPGRSRATG
jgi:hypothetical protein